ncbi:MAG: hypothetical protein R6U96_13810 [Promethearchaeia archaeon]
MSHLGVDLGNFAQNIDSKKNLAILSLVSSAHAGHHRSSLMFEYVDNHGLWFSPNCHRK